MATGRCYLMTWHFAFFDLNFHIFGFFSEIQQFSQCSNFRHSTLPIPAIFCVRFVHNLQSSVINIFWWFLFGNNRTFLPYDVTFCVFLFEFLFFRIFWSNLAFLLFFCIFWLSTLPIPAISVSDLCTTCRAALWIFFDDLFFVATVCSYLMTWHFAFYDLNSYFLDFPTKNKHFSECVMIRLPILAILLVFRVRCLLPPTPALCR